ncbi:hypothetical protein HY490_03480 [Candidatus Woesearchaeota archaeon]|nr:hypothetical protein [Candidatus Woesearchaeota archaeon]
MKRVVYLLVLLCVLDVVLAQTTISECVAQGCRPVRIRVSSSPPAVCVTASPIVGLRQFKLSTPVCCCEQDVFNSILAFQKEIQANNDNFPPAGTSDFRVIAGKRNVLLSAPHATRHVREGAAKDADFCTGAIARAVAELTGATVIFTTHKSANDPNFVDAVDGRLIPYKQALADLSRAGGLTAVLDVHGASETQPFDVDFGTLNGKSVLGNPLLIHLLSASFKAEGFGELTSNVFAAEQQASVTKFASQQLGIPAVQLEINRKFRCQTKEDTLRLVRAMVRVINAI